TYKAGAPSGHAGAPNDFSARTCAISTCHGGSAPLQNGWITSNVPSKGYRADSTYNITFKVIAGGKSRFGYMGSPQDGMGNQMGSFTTLDSKSQIRDAGKYTTHTTLGTNSVDSAAWTVEWVAPTLGSGNVTMYAAFNAANNNGTKTGDVIYTSNLLIQEDTSALTFIANIEFDFQYNLYPNPSNGNIFLDFRTNKGGNITINLMNLQGQQVQTLMSEYRSGGHQTLSLSLEESIPEGMYFIWIRAGDDNYFEKLIVL
ncbi:MAG: T9SS type A sorting domain-containing protein, partial [Bacteroidetes bacterium]|nr:T9SS type A sorting domain-containing protein [Bacteroidota bacterium]